jgi:hypothetical protein
MKIDFNRTFLPLDSGYIENVNGRIIIGDKLKVVVSKNILYIFVR